MPPAIAAAPWLIPAITGAGVIGGAALQSRGQNRATAAAERAQSEALAFEREREAARQREHQARENAYMQQWNAYQAQRAALMARYGINLGGTPAGGRQHLGGGPKAPASQAPVAPQAAPMAPGGPMPEAPPALAPTGAPGASMGPSGMTLGRLLQGETSPWDWNVWGDYAAR